MKESIEQIYSELREYGYTMQDILEMNKTVEELCPLLEALREWAIKPTDPEWKKYQLDGKYTPDKQHSQQGKRRHFCKCCGKTIVFGTASDISIGGKRK